MNENKPDAPDETFQEGVTPVQAFSTPVLPADPGTETRLRQGRPPRVATGKLCESAGTDGSAQAGAQPRAEPHAGP